MTPFDNIASGAGAGTGKAGVCESALSVFSPERWVKVVLQVRAVVGCTLEIQRGVL